MFSDVNPFATQSPGVLGNSSLNNLSFPASNSAGGGMEFGDVKMIFNPPDAFGENSFNTGVFENNDFGFGQPQTGFGS